MSCLKLHIGTVPNLRLAYSKKGQKLLKIRGRYYPFGLEHKGYNNVINGTENNYKTYNGKELNEELGLNWLDYGKRNYDPAIGRFFNEDRFAEKYHSKTPYQYAANNPIKFVDVMGDSIRVTGSKSALLSLQHF